ncbi:MULTISPECIES: HTTM domain-containing protein [unclassified Plantibacter]|uniref:HTTM domain-containing protein n=1 Tax=unclassified Plantibacter TaxID=2624265 RepID=UPI0006F6B10F|nr:MULTISPECIES: HTTM domain-containing protein [unclassified Plantibacter]KQQ49739.1 hypothetical protein ASF68_18090 [Plantibacter sp. Leaf314]
MNAVRTGFDRFTGWVTGAKHAGYSLSALRILYGIAIVSFLLTSLADRHYLWGVASRWVDPEARRRAWFPLFEVVFTKDSAFLFDLAYGALIVLGVLFLIGWQTRFVTPVLLVFWVGLATNSTVLTNGGDTILRITLLFLVFANLSRHWSVDAWLARRRGREPRPLLRGRLAIPEWLGNAANNTAVLLCGYQIMLVYVNSGIYKLMGPEWREGTAFYYSLVLDVFRPFPALSDLAWQIAPFVWVATFLSVWVQLLFPVLVLWRPTRIVALGFTILMHLGIGLFLGLWPFSLAMIALDLLFVRDRTWVATGRWATHAGGVLRQLLPDRSASVGREAAERPVTTAAGSPS